MVAIGMGLIMIIAIIGGGALAVNALFGLTR